MLAEWQAYWRVAGCQPAAGDLRHAELMALLANAHSIRGGFRPDEFRHGYRRPPRRQSTEEIVRIMQLL